MIRQSIFGPLIRVALAGIFSVITATAATAQVPSPKDIFGFEPGDDYSLASYEQMETFYKSLAANSDRVELRVIGKSALGRDLYLLTISSPENLANQARYKEISTSLARATVDEATAEALAAEGKAVVWLDGGLHATELAHGQMMNALAYRLATDDSAEMMEIRDNVIMLLMMQMNPDGLEIVRKWYEGVLGTPYEASGPPELYHHYVGHDNNRDFFMNNMPESKAVANVIYREWYPQIVFNHHQTSPPYARIVIPPYSDPLNPAIHPGVTTGLNEVGAAMANRFALKKMRGAISDVGFDMWWNGGMRTVPYFHNMIGILTETAHSSPSPTFYDPEKFGKMRAHRARRNGISVEGGIEEVDDTRVLYPYAWKGGESRFRDPVRYMITASMATLRIASDSRKKWLTNIYQMGRDAIAAGNEGTQHYVIPADQRDPGESRNMVNVLLEGGVDVRVADKDFRAGGERYGEGSYIVDAAQAFRPYLYDLLEKQVYPDQSATPGGPPDPPYDIAGWTLPMQMGVTVDKVSDPVDVDSTVLTAPAAATPGEVTGRGDYGFALDTTTNASIAAVNELLRAGVSVSRSSDAFRAGRSDFPAGSFVVEGGRDAVEAAARNHGVSFAALSRSPSDSLAALSLPRVGLYKSWVASMDEGWTRWVLETYGFEIVSLHDEDLRSGDLSGLDAIILPHPDGSVPGASSSDKLLNGHPTGTMPDQYVGGMGLKGALALESYMEAGGTLLTFGGATGYAMDLFGLPVRNVVGSMGPRQFFIPGSLIRANVKADSPLTYGVADEVAVSFVRGAAFALPNQAEIVELGRGMVKLRAAKPDLPVTSLVDYADEDLLMSGWARGAEHIAGHSAMMRVGVGDGEAILFGFRPQFRGQPRGTYKLMFNALLNAASE